MPFFTYHRSFYLIILLFATLVVNAQNKKDSTHTLVTDFKLRPYLNISTYRIGEKGLSANSSYLKSITYKFKESNLGLAIPFLTRNFYKDSSARFKSNITLLATLSSQKSVSTFSFMDPIENVRTSVGLRGIYFNGDKNIWLLNLSPFFAEDRNTINNARLRMFGDFIFSRVVNEKFSYRLGLSYTYRFGGGRFLPVLGMRIGNYNKGFLMIQIPKNISYTHKISKNGYLGIYMRPYGGTYRFKIQNGDDAIINQNFINKPLVLNRTEYLTGLMLNYGIGKHTYLDFGLGATTRRSVTILENKNINGRGGNGIFGGKGKTLDMLNAGFVTIGLTFYFGKPTYYGAFSPLSEITTLNTTYDPGDVNNTNNGATNDHNVVDPRDIKSKEAQKELETNFRDIQDFLEE